VIIEPTEALTVIDVKLRLRSRRSAMPGKPCSGPTHTAKAAAEIARQLKLRNIGGVVDHRLHRLESRRDPVDAAEAFQPKAVRDDTARPRLPSSPSSAWLNSRATPGPDILWLFGLACPSCGGLGMWRAPGTRFASTPGHGDGLVRFGGFRPGPTFVSPWRHRIQWRRRGGRGKRAARSSEAVEATGQCTGSGSPASSASPVEAAAGLCQ